jgi:probable HAF family extracellular repeat protein
LSTYTLTDLGTLGGPGSEAFAVNNAGQVVGGSFPVGESSLHPFLWDNVNGMQDLGTLRDVHNPVVPSQSLGINSKGMIVGQAVVDSLHYHAFLYQDGTMTDLAALAGLDPRANSAAYGINEAGQAVGFAFFGNGQEHAFFWDATNGVQDLGTFGGSISFAYGINSSGQVVGRASFDGDEGEDAFLWDNKNGLQDLHVSGSANAINDAGQIVGGSGHAFLYSAGTVTDLGTLAGFSGSTALAINNLGQVTGYATGRDQLHHHAFVYADGILADLNDLIPPDTGLTINEATGINDAGQIVGFAADRGLHFHAVLLTPDDGSAPRRVEPGVVRLLAFSVAAPSVVDTALAPQALPAPLRPVPETVALLPAGATLGEATDTVFAGSHRTHVPAPGDGWEIKGLGLGLDLALPV